jgi:hypothetical protein
VIPHAAGVSATMAVLPEPFYCLERPMVALIPWTPPEFESNVQALIHLCLQRRASGGGIVLGAGWPYESAVFRLLAVAATRLRRAGLAVEVCGTPYCSLAAPRRPEADIAILLDAPSYASLDGWLESKRGQVTVLVGPEADWLLATALPIDFLAEGADAGFSDRAARHVRSLRDLWRGAASEVRSALLVNALGCDVPADLVALPAGAPFLPVGDGEFVTLPSQWLAWQAIAEFAEELDRAWESEATRRAPPALLERAAYRFGARRAAKNRRRAVRL